MLNWQSYYFSGKVSYGAKPDMFFGHLPPSMAPVTLRTSMFFENCIEEIN